MTIYQPSSPTDFHIFQRGWNHQPDIHIHIYIYTCSIVMLNYQRVSDISIWYDCELATFQAASCPSHVPSDSLGQDSLLATAKYTKRDTYMEKDWSQPSRWGWKNVEFFRSQFFLLGNLSFQNPIYQAKSWVSRTCCCKSIIIHILYILYIYISYIYIYVSRSPILY